MPLEPRAKIDGPDGDPSVVPITMGSRRAREFEYGPFRLTDAYFPAGEVLQPHTHDRVTFAIMLEGGFDLLIGGRRLDCSAGFVFTEPGGDRHANYIGTEGARVLVVQPDAESEFPRPCVSMLDRVNHFRSRAISRIARRLSRELADPDDVTPLEGQALALEMFSIAARLESERILCGEPPAWFRRVEELIHDRFREPLRLADLAAEAEVHSAHLGRVFRKRYGTSPGRYIRRLRIEWAEERLSAGDEPISTIALRAGFADQAHFTRAFKREMGVPPGSYRRLSRR